MQQGQRREAAPAATSAFKNPECTEMRSASLAVDIEKQKLPLGRVTYVV